MNSFSCIEPWASRFSHGSCYLLATAGSLPKEELYSPMLVFNVCEQERMWL